MAPQTLDTVDAAAAWLAARVRGTLASDSRLLQPGDGFVAWPGATVDARRHVPDALSRGVAACLVEAGAADAAALDDARVAALPDLKARAGEVAHRFFGRPSERLALIACTGTNGKTSSSWWIAQALSALGRRCGVVGTLGVGEPPAPGRPAELRDSGLTTPDAVRLHAELKRFADAGFAACAIEASSIGLVDHRLVGAQVAVALFTNLTRDHLDVHGSMERYWAAKRSLFERPELRAAVINVDDEHGAGLAADLAGGAVDTWSFSLRGPARLRGSHLRRDGGGLAFDVHEGGETVALRTALAGDFNASNLLGVIGVLRALGVALADAAAATAVLTPVPGRMQRVVVPGVAGPDVIVDYAHTPDALEQALAALRPLAGERGGRLWCVFGCGGQRDATKRPLMGAIAARLADHVVLTSDNPRDEAPGFILSQILAGVVGRDDVDVIEERAEAIAHALRDAAPQDVVLVAGKGHEAMQEIAGVKRPFSDAAEAAAALRLRAGAAR